MKNMVKNFLIDAGYSDDEVERGMKYAEEKGYDSADELGQLALARILYSDSQIDRGEVVGWDPVDWSEYEH